MKQEWEERQDEQMKEKYYGYCPVTVHRKSHLYTWGNVVRLQRAFTSKNNWMFLLSWKRVMFWFLHGNVQRIETVEKVPFLVSWGHSLGKQTRFCNPRSEETLGWRNYMTQVFVVNNLTNISSEFHLRSNSQYNHFIFCKLLPSCSKKIHYKWQSFE